MIDNPTARHAFTLAEVLIALALLGVIAAFSIPKILQSVGDQEQKSLFRETYASISEIVNGGNLAGELPGQSLVDYLSTRLNAVKVCKTESLSEGCIVSGQIAGPYGMGEDDEPGFILPNGVAITGIMNGNPNGSGYSEGFILDLNGNNQPNLIGSDQIYLGICYGRGTCPTLQNQKAGTIMPYSHVNLGEPERTRNQQRFAQLLN